MGTIRNPLKRNGPVGALPPPSLSASDPTSLLARGYTSRYLGPKIPLTSLSSEEMDKDLRHFQAYRAAVLSYRQQYYLAVNRLVSPAAPPPSATTSSTPPDANNNGSNNHSGCDASSAPQLLTSLPVRIDPEEEKRLALLRKKIRVAEFHREQAEQQYVALRAHYVQTAQDLQHSASQRDAIITFLQETVQQRSNAVGLMRAKLQMTRDVLASLQTRAEVLAEAATSEQAPGSAVAAAAAAPDDDPLLSVWNQVDEDLKKLAASSRPRKKKPMPWPCTKLPATPFDVPLLLSTLSTAPEKTAAFAANAFGAHDHSMCWLDDCVRPPVVDSDEDDDASAADEESIEVLRKQAELLQTQLADERRESQALYAKIAEARGKNDEWVSIICLVRLETESVLHRHNVLLESEPATEAADRLHQQATEEREAAAAAVVAAAEAARLDQSVASEEVVVEGGTEMTTTTANDDNLNASTGSTAAASESSSNKAALPHAMAAVADDANDGDDEGSNNDEEEEGELPPGGEKRPAEADIDADVNKKRRKP